MFIPPLTRETTPFPPAHAALTEFSSAIIFNLIRRLSSHPHSSIMARRLNRVLYRLIRRRIQRSVSAADDWGYLYASQEKRNVYKLGMSNNLERRMNEHDTQCTNPARRWLGYIAVPWRRRAGACFKRSYCPVTHFFCSQRHLLTFTSNESA